ncbi:DUF4365 domain-containing protein [Clostridium sp. WILCCON 0269]|uniref:DUF4365 domain-containing protein n=1 Tax=Candidatus Clostridium eludens TaxID=3381663 RepID=A0ABW8SJU6_9CLOT
MKLPGYTDNAKQDDKTVSLLKYILASHERVMSNFIVSGDKYPNIDGFIELVNDNSEPIGKFEVQIKTLPKNHNGKYPNMPVSTINYAMEVSDSPVLFIYGDTDKQKLYWIHASQDYLKELPIRPNQKSKSINLKLENEISISNTNYIIDWTNTILEHKKKYKYYLVHRQEYDDLKKFSDASLGMREDYFKEVHNFLDYYNNLLDTDFQVVKDFFYPSSWKVGISIHNYSKNYVGFSIYPISYFENNVQIRIMSDAEAKNFNDKYNNFRMCNYNPIRNHYKALAYELIKDKIKVILKNFFLSIDNNSRALYSNILFTFMDMIAAQYKFRESETLKGTYFNDSCDINEVSIVVTKLLPVIFAELSSKSINKGYYTRVVGQVPIFDPFSGLAIIHEDTNLEELYKSLEKGELSYEPIILYNEKFPFTTLLDSIRILKSLGIGSVKRIFKPRNYIRMSNYGSSFWNVWDNNDLLVNLKSYVTNVYDSYHKFLRHNFSRLYEELKLTKNDIDVYIKLVKTEDDNICPSYDVLFYKDIVETPNVNIITEENGDSMIRDIDWNVFSKQVSGIFENNIDRLSILNKCYALLEGKLFKYIDEKIHYYK